MPKFPSQPPLRAVRMSLFPAKGSLDEAVNYCKSQVPVEDGNKMHSLLMIYHNTLINSLESK